MHWSQQEQRQKGLNQQIRTNDSAVSNNDDVGYLGDSNVVSDGDRRTPQRLVQAILKTTKQIIMSRAMMMLGVISTILVSHLRIYVET